MGQVISYGGYFVPQREGLCKRDGTSHNVYNLGIRPIPTSSLFPFHLGKAQLKPSGIAMQTPPSQESFHETCSEWAAISQVVK